MIDAEKIFAQSKLADVIRKENEEKKLVGNSVGGKGGYREVSTQMGTEYKKSRDYFLILFGNDIHVTKCSFYTLVAKNIKI